MVILPNVRPDFLYRKSTITATTVAPPDRRIRGGQLAGKDRSLCGLHDAYGATLVQRKERSAGEARKGRP